MATTEQLMYQYGVAWFGFDETSGNVIDKLGNNYVGTVTGAIRVEGWNGEGNALNLTGSPNFVSFNVPVIPLGEKTIRFKIKPPTLEPTTRILDSSSSATSGCSTLLVDGKIRFIIRTSGATQNPYVDSSSSLIANKWNDILISYNGKNESKNVYITINGITSIHYLNTTDLPSYGNLFIGKINPLLSPTTNVSEYFNGQLDDLQIYNKALSPSDFTQKRLVVKTTDNKNLVLSPTSTRVKKIPNTVEYIMLNQGRIVREIDSAIDSQPIDFTKITTEYEIVSNDKTPLGNGRMITIPIGSDFKTAMIEDNY